MLFHGGGKHHYVVQVQKKGLTLLVHKQPLHQPLEGAWGITERHPFPFKKTKRCTKGGLVFIPPLWLYLVVPTSEVHGRKPPGPCQRVQGFLYPRHRESIFYSFCIQLAVVYTHTQGAILLFGQDDGGSVRTTDTYPDTSVRNKSVIKAF